MIGRRQRGTHFDSPEGGRRAARRPRQRCIEVRYFEHDITGQLFLGSCYWAVLHQAVAACEAHSGCCRRGQEPVALYDDACLVQRTDIGVPGVPIGSGAFGGVALSGNLTSFS
ncbi:MAG: hypothetical protein BGO83_18745 [Devosia sp. 66-14]|nr:MAG: hypothetical protein ABS47_10410 [Devosia sp. SCN 66-27]OJX22813.1 MAG: hypothetical protein BGO83_18745 [Devosia sp. 66-14]